MKDNENSLFKKSNVSIKFTVPLLWKDKHDEFDTALDGKKGEERSAARQAFLEEHAAIRFVFRRLPAKIISNANKRATAAVWNVVESEGRTAMQAGDRMLFVQKLSECIWEQLQRYVDSIETKSDEGEWKPIEKKRIGSEIEALSSEYPEEIEFLANEYLVAVEDDRKKAEADADFLAKGSSTDS